MAENEVIVDVVASLDQFAKTLDDAEKRGNKFINDMSKTFKKLKVGIDTSSVEKVTAELEKASKKIKALEESINKRNASDKSKEDKRAEREANAKIKADEKAANAAERLREREERKEAAASERKRRKEIADAEATAQAIFKIQENAHRRNVASAEQMNRITQNIFKKSLDNQVSTTTKNMASAMKFQYGEAKGIIADYQANEKFKESLKKTFVYDTMKNTTKEMRASEAEKVRIEKAKNKEDERIDRADNRRAEKEKEAAQAKSSDYAMKAAAARFQSNINELLGVRMHGNQYVPNRSAEQAKADMIHAFNVRDWENKRRADRLLESKKISGFNDIGEETTKERRSRQFLGINAFYQLSDVLSGLSSGLPVKQVAAQQGFQIADLMMRSSAGGHNLIKDMFSTVKESFGGLMTASGALTVGLIAAAGAATYSAYAYNNANREVANSRVMKGRISGYTSDELIGAAEGKSGTNLSMSERKKSIAALTASGVQGDVAEGLLGNMFKYSRATNQSVSDAATELGSIFAEPAKGIDELAKRFGSVDEGAKKVIKDLAEAGDQVGASRRMFMLFSKQMEEMEYSIDPLSYAWSKFSNTMSDTGSGMSKFFSSMVMPKDWTSQLEDANNELERLKELAKNSGSDNSITDGMWLGGLTGNIEQQVEAAQKKRDNLEKLVNARKARAQDQQDKAIQSANTSSAKAMMNEFDTELEDSYGIGRRHLQLLDDMITKYGGVADAAKATGVSVERFSEVQRRMTSVYGPSGTFLTGSESRYALAAARVDKASAVGDDEQLAAARREIEAKNANDVRANTNEEITNASREMFSGRFASVRKEAIDLLYAGQAAALEGWKRQVAEIKAEAEKQKSMLGTADTGDEEANARREDARRQIDENAKKKIDTASQETLTNLGADKVAQDIQAATSGLQGYNKSLKEISLEEQRHISLYDGNVAAQEKIREIYQSKITALQKQVALESELSLLAARNENEVVGLVGLKKTLEEINREYERRLALVSGNAEAEANLKKEFEYKKDTARKDAIQGPMIEAAFASKEAKDKVALMGETFGRSAADVEYLTKKMEMYQKYARAGVTEFTPEMVQNIENYARGMGQAAGEADRLAKAQQRVIDEADDIRSGSSEALKTFVNDLRQGKSAAEALADALNRIVDKLLDRFENMFIESLFGKSGTPMGGGGDSSLLGGLLSGLWGGSGNTNGTKAPVPSYAATSQIAGAPMNIIPTTVSSAAQASNYISPIGELTANAKGYVDPNAYYLKTREYVANSRLNGFVPADGAKYGIKTGSPDEWTRLISANTKQESDFNINSRGDNGMSRGLGQMTVGDGRGSWGKGLTGTWQDIYNPDKAAKAIVNAHENFIVKDGRIAGQVGGEWQGIARLNGSYRRPDETLRHMDFASKLEESARQQQITMLNKSNESLSQFSNSAANADTSVSKLADGLGSVGNVAQNATMNASGAQGSGITGNGFGVIGLLFGIFKQFAGFFAEGGSIPSGQWGVTGEKGIELVRGPATVTPIGKLSAGGVGGGAMVYSPTHNITVNGSGGTAAQNNDLAKQITDMVTAETKKIFAAESKNQMRPGGMFTQKAYTM